MPSEGEPDDQRAVLLVVHDPRLRSALRRLLTAMLDAGRAQVIVAPNADVARWHATRLMPGVAVIDLMPVPDRVHELARSLREGGWSVLLVGGRDVSTQHADSSTHVHVDTGVDPDKVVGIVSDLLDHTPTDRKFDDLAAAD